MSAVVVVAAADDNTAPAAALAQRLRLPLVPNSAALPPNCVAYLCYASDRLQLFPADNRQSGPIFVDFVAGTLARRVQARGELIVKAVKGRSKDALHVVDATAGLGRDAFVLAAHGFALTLIERNAVAAALLEDGLQRATHSPAETIAARMQLWQGEAIAHFAALAGAQKPDVIYLDPMFADVENTAQVKKEMRLFRQLLSIESPSDEQQMLAAARSAARLRVVVKRALKAPDFAGSEPAYTLAGKAIRYDVYPC